MQLSEIFLPATHCSECGAGIPEGGFRAMAGTAHVHHPHDAAASRPLHRCEACEVERIRKRAALKFAARIKGQAPA